MKQEYIITDQLEADLLYTSHLGDQNSDVFPFMVTIGKVKNVRSLSQNKLLWMWYAEMRDWINEVNGQLYDTEALHERMKKMFLYPIVYEFKDEVINKYSTKKLNTKEFTAYLERIDMYCADRLNLILKHPNDVFNEAMGRNEKP